MLTVPGGAAKRARTPAMSEMIAKADDPPVIKQIFSHKCPSFDKFVADMTSDMKESFKTYVMKCQHGQRVVEWIINQISLNKQLQETTNLN